LNSQLGHTRQFWKKTWCYFSFVFNCTCIFFSCCTIRVPSHTLTRTWITLWFIR